MKILIPIITALFIQGCFVSDTLTLVKDGIGPDYCKKDEFVRHDIRRRVNKMLEKGKWKTTVRIDCLGGVPALTITSRTKF